MAGFFAKKMSREHRKLIKQNELALDWLEQLGSTATALGTSEEDREHLMVIENYRIVVDEARMQLAMTRYCRRKRFPLTSISIEILDEYTMILVAHKNSSRSNLEL